LYPWGQAVYQSVTQPDKMFYDKHRA